MAADQSDVQLFVHAHDSELANVVFGYRSRAQLQVIDHHDDVGRPGLWKWPDDTGLVTLYNVIVGDKSADFVVVGLNIATRKLVLGSSPFLKRTAVGYIFEVSASGPDHTIAKSVQKSETDTGKTTTSGSEYGGKVTGGLAWLGGEVSGKRSSSTTDPTQSSARQGTYTDTYTEKTITGLKVQPRVDIPQMAFLRPSQPSRQYV